MRVNIHEKEGIVIFELEGKITIGESVDLKRLVDEQIAASGSAPKLLFNLDRVSALDSSGLGVLIAAHLSVGRKEGRIGVINISANIRNLLVMAKLIAVLEHFDSEEQAIDSLRSD